MICQGEGSRGDAVAKSTIYAGLFLGHVLVMACSL